MGRGSSPGDLTIPDDARGVVLFAHGSGSGRHSPRNQAVAAALNERGLATMLTDLLTEAEEQLEATTRHLRFDIGLLTERLLVASDWLAHDPSTEHLPLGLFGASTGAAAALSAAAQSDPERVYAVVSRGGRPDLAQDALAQVRAPTLLIVGGLDTTVLALNRDALEQLQTERDLSVIPGATHLFEEPGALEEVSRLAGDWFEHHVPK
ncbi:dienelactone hydrolase family protein [Phytoactinopolyspora halotolerans]|uniref:Dienelactone hydrolase domain-containing protein n=1 Tax=Phytoactinopolyspora halotolerans TaxID=1981512 RepID=A0A6L9S3M8_9ACTN|nr:alpha/beta family hydrolase [Phytoactinopolyspora halotolerans]NED99440.1 hypothetical protein [Phytoactinopolyspora halotolerans]